MAPTVPSNLSLLQPRRVARRGALVSLVGLVALGTAAAPGCRGDADGRDPAFDTGDRDMTLSELLAPRQTVAGGQPVAVVEGALPMVYLVEQAATVRVVDLTTGRTLVTRQAGEAAIVSADARAGVRIGGELVWPGPMPLDHRYAIRVGPPEAPTTAPAEGQPHQNNGSPGAGAVAPSRPGDPPEDGQPPPRPPPAP